MTRCNHHTFLLPANYVQWFNLSYIPSATEKSTLLKKNRVADKTYICNIFLET